MQGEEEFCILGCDEILLRWCQTMKEIVGERLTLDKVGADEVAFLRELHMYGAYVAAERRQMASDIGFLARLPQQTSLLPGSRCEYYQFFAIVQI